MPNLHDSMKLTRSWTLSLREASSIFLALYGSAALSPVSVLLNFSAIVSGIEDERYLGKSFFGVRRFGVLMERVLENEEVSKEERAERESDVERRVKVE